MHHIYYAAYRYYRYYLHTVIYYIQITSVHTHPTLARARSHPGFGVTDTRSHRLMLIIADDDAAVAVDEDVDVAVDHNESDVTMSLITISLSTSASASSTAGVPIRLSALAAPATALRRAAPSSSSPAPPAASAAPAPRGRRRRRRCGGSPVRGAVSRSRPGPRPAGSPGAAGGAGAAAQVVWAPRAWTAWPGQQRRPTSWRSTARIEGLKCGDSRRMVSAAGFHDALDSQTGVLRLKRLELLF